MVCSQHHVDDTTNLSAKVVWCGATMSAGYDDSGITVMSAKLVRKAYLTSWFAVDIISSLPYELVVLFQR